MACQLACIIGVCMQACRTRPSQVTHLVLKVDLVPVKLVDRGAQVSHLHPSHNVMVQYVGTQRLVKIRQVDRGLPARMVHLSACMHERGQQFA